MKTFVLVSIVLLMSAIAYLVAGLLVILISEAF